jgi:hypothetical protein
MPPSPQPGRSPAVYSVAYIDVGALPDFGGRHYVYAWAAWLVPPTGRPWTTPLGTGSIEQSGPNGGNPRSEEQAEIAADDLLRAKLGERIETWRIDASFARAAYREAQGQAPNWRASRETKKRYAKPKGFSRPPTTPAREFLKAESYESAQEWLRGIRNGIHDPSALTALGLTASANEADVRRAFRRLAVVTHPDRGGSTAAFIQLKANFDKALAVVRR